MPEKIQRTSCVIRLRRFSGLSGHFSVSISDSQGTPLMLLQSNRCLNLFIAHTDKETSLEGFASCSPSRKIAGCFILFCLPCLGRREINLLAKKPRWSWPGGVTSVLPWTCTEKESWEIERRKRRLKKTVFGRPFSSYGRFMRALDLQFGRFPDGCRMRREESLPSRAWIWRALALDFARCGAPLRGPSLSTATLTLFLLSLSKPIRLKILDHPLGYDDQDLISNRTKIRLCR